MSRLRGENFGTEPKSSFFTASTDNKKNPFKSGGLPDERTQSKMKEVDQKINEIFARDFSNERQAYKEFDPAKNFKRLKYEVGDEQQDSRDLNRPIDDFWNKQDRDINTDIDSGSSQMRRGNEGKYKVFSSRKISQNTHTDSR